MLSNSFRLLQRTSSLSLRNYSRGIIAYKNIIENVPQLGESITEGSVSQWMKKVGDHVQPDEVVVVVETDKVTVDIKAPNGGVIKKIFVEDLVEVGKPLYEIDTDENAIASAPSTQSATTTSTTTSAPAPSSHKTGHRVPLIKFVGKRDHKKILAERQQKTSTLTPIPAPLKTPPIPASDIPKKPQTGVDFLTLKDQAWFGRPKLSQEEMEAVDTGISLC